MRIYLWPALFLLVACGSSESSDGLIADSVSLPDSLAQADTVQLIEDEFISNFTNSGDEYSNVDVFFCQIGIYQKPAILMIEEAITDEINGDGDYAGVKGHYFYVKHQKDLDLEGGLDIINGQYSLKESYKGKASGFIRFSTNDVGDNYWALSEESADKQEFNFKKLTPKNEETRTFQIKKERYSENHDVMDMSAEEETWEEVTDELALVFINENLMAFDYSVVRTNFHMGSAQGLAEKNKEGKFVWLGEEGCVLTFSIRDQSIDIVDEGCNYYHGARATLDGNFSK